MGKVEKLANRQPSAEAMEKAQLIERGKRFRELLNRANDVPKEVPALRRFLDENPDVFPMAETLPAIVRRVTVEKVFAGDGARLVGDRQIEQLKEELSSENPSRAESLLLDAVILCWLRVQYTEYYRASLMGGDQSLRHVEFIEKILTQSYNRFTKALTALVRVQCLTMPKPKAESSLDRSLKAVRLLKAMGAD